MIRKLIYMVLLCVIFQVVKAQKEGKYIDRGDATLYYEVQGNGYPVLLLHGGLGKIEGYVSLIDALSTRYKVIAISTRGHGKSGIGTHPYSFALLAEDAIAILKKEEITCTNVIGFSDGASTALYMAAYYPEHIKRVVALSGAISLSGCREEGYEWMQTISSEMIKKNNPDWAAKLFKEISPQRMDSLIEYLRPMWLTKEYVSVNKLALITAPTLIIGGGKDFFYKEEHFVFISQTIPGAKLILFPEGGHHLNTPEVVENQIIPFLNSSSE